MSKSSSTKRPEGHSSSSEGQFRIGMFGELELPLLYGKQSLVSAGEGDVVC